MTSLMAASLVVNGAPLCQMTGETHDRTADGSRSCPDSARLRLARSSHLRGAQRFQRWEGRSPQRDAQHDDERG